MPKVLETQHRPVLTLLTGHFDETSGYRAYREQGVGDWLLIHTLNGCGRFGHAGGELIARPGDWVLLRPGTRHDYGVAVGASSWELLWAHFQPRSEWRVLLDWPLVNRGLMRLALDDALIVARFVASHHLLASQAPHRELAAMNALEDVLIQLSAHNPLSAAAGGDPRIRAALAYIDEHFAERIVLADIARAVGLSPSRLAHLFRAQTGQTIGTTLEARRLGRAADLLARTGFSIQQIAAAVGFDNPFYFSNRFNARTGKSPTAYRAARDINLGS